MSYICNVIFRRTILQNLFLLLLLPVALSAQPRISELLTKLDHATTDTGKITAYRKIILYYAAVNPDSQSWYADQAIAYARQKNTEKGEADIIAQLSVIDQNQGRKDLAKQRGLEALTTYRRIKDLKNVAEMLHNLGTIEASKGNYDSAIKYYVTALKVYDSVTDYHGQMLTYMNLGSLYMEHMDTANARKYLTIAEEISKKAPLSDATIYMYNVIAILYAESGRNDTALALFTHNLELSDKPAFVNSHLECLIYLGEFHLDAGNAQEGLKYLEQALRIAEDNKIPEMEANILLDIARVYETSNTALALEYLQRAKKFSESIGSETYLMRVYNEFAKIYEQQGNYKEAFNSLKHGQKLSDSIFSINKAKEIANIDAAYRFETNQRIRELEVLSRRNATQRDIIITVAAVLIIMFSIILYYYRRGTRLNKKLAAHEKQLEELNSMKDKLFSVIGHDLRGPIARIPAIIDIYEAENTTAEERKFMLDSLKEHTKASLETFDKLLYWGQSLVKGISLRQQKMQPKSYINESIELKKMKGIEKNITITDTTPPDIYIYSDPSIFDFIIRNLLANALKYTRHNGSVEISADSISKPGFTVFAVTDSGIGIPKEQQANLFTSLKSSKGTDNEGGHGIGLMLCKQFAIQNGGDIWLESEPGKGTTFYFSVKSHG